MSELKRRRGRPAQRTRKPKPPKETKPIDKTLDLDMVEYYRKGLQSSTPRYQAHLRAVIDAYKCQGEAQAWNVYEAQRNLDSRHYEWFYYRDFRCITALAQEGT